MSAGGAESVSLHQATPADAELIYSFMRQLRIEDHMQQHDWADEPTVRAALRDLIDDPNLGRILVVKSGGVVAGYAAVVFFHSLEYAGRCGLLDEFFLERGQRGKGVGKAALKWICRTAPQWGVRALFLEVSAENSVAQGLYRSAGFEKRPYHFLVRSTFQREEA